MASVRRCTYHLGCRKVHQYICLLFQVFQLTQAYGLHVEQHDVAKLPCGNSLSSRSIHTVQWFKVYPDTSNYPLAQSFGGQLIATRKYNMTSDFSLVIQDVRIEDEGRYKCYVHSSDLLPDYDEYINLNVSDDEVTKDVQVVIIPTDDHLGTNSTKPYPVDVSSAKPPTSQPNVALVALVIVPIVVIFISVVYVIRRHFRKGGKGGIEEANHLSSLDSTDQGQHHVTEQTTTVQKEANAEEQETSRFLVPDLAYPGNLQHRAPDIHSEETTSAHTEDSIGKKNETNGEETQIPMETANHQILSAPDVTQENTTDAQRDDVDRKRDRFQKQDTVFKTALDFVTKESNTRVHASDNTKGTEHTDKSNMSSRPNLADPPEGQSGKLPVIHEEATDEPTDAIARKRASFANKEPQFVTALEFQNDETKDILHSAKSGPPEIDSSATRMEEEGAQV